MKVFPLFRDWLCPWRRRRQEGLQVCRYISDQVPVNANIWILHILKHCHVVDKYDLTSFSIKEMQSMHLFPFYIILIYATTSRDTPVTYLFSRHCLFHTYLSIALLCSDMSYMGRESMSTDGRSTVLPSANINHGNQVTPVKIKRQQLPVRYLTRGFFFCPLGCGSLDSMCLSHFSWNMIAKISSIFSQSHNVIDVSVHIQSISARSSNKNGTAMNLQRQCMLHSTDLL